MKTCYFGESFAVNGAIQLFLFFLLARRRDSVKDPKSLSAASCCSVNCISVKLDEAQRVKARELFRFKNPTYRHQRDFIFNWFEDNQPTPGEFTYSIMGVSVCWKTWILVLGIPRSTFFNWKSDFLKGRVNPDHGASLTLKRCPKTEVALHFLESFFKENCDYLPTSDVWNLPSSSSKDEIYDEMATSVEARGQPCCSKPNFIKLWNQQFPHVKIPKVRVMKNIMYSGSF